MREFILLCARDFLAEGLEASSAEIYGIFFPSRKQSDFLYYSKYYFDF